MDPARLCIAGPKGTSRLEPRVMDVLVALAARAPDPVSREALIDAVWGGAVVTDGVLSRCISILRDSLGDDCTAPRFIQTLSKKGYRLLPPVGYIESSPLRTGRRGPPRGPRRRRRCRSRCCPSSTSLATSPTSTWPTA